MAEAVLGRGGRQLHHPRHAVQPRRRAAACCSTQASRRSAIRRSATRWRSTRARRNSTAASSRGSTASSFGIVVNRDAQRFYDEGEDFWPKRYAIWGRLVAQQPDQIAYSIIDAKSIGLFMPSIFPPIAAPTSRELAAKLGLDRGGARSDGRAIQRRGAAGHVRPHGARRLPHRRPRPAEDAIGRARSTRRRSTAIRCGPASPSPISASR